MTRSPADLSPCPVIILAGGKSSRFGEPKALAQLGNRTLIERVYERVAGQTSGPILLNAPADFEAPIKLERIEDRLHADLGPLAGLHTALSWAQEHDHQVIATVPVDTPFLPRDLLAKLQTARAPCFAQSGGRDHPTIGLWQSEHLARLEHAIEGGMRAARAWAETCGATEVAFEKAGKIDPLFNINTKEDLARAQELIKHR